MASIAKGASWSGAVSTVPAAIDVTSNQTMNTVMRTVVVVDE
jgi:hypothetical protein